jgi:predicted nucleic acid-binding protein
MSVMPYRDALFDTGLVIGLRSGMDAALVICKEWTDRDRVFTLSEVTVLAVLADSRDEDDRRERMEFLNNCRLVGLKVQVARTAERIARSILLPTRLSADDLLVAATALIEKLPLYSLDPERYTGVAGLTVLPAR